MKHILFLLLFLPVLAYAQFPANPNKIRLGNQTTADGLVVRTAASPSWTPSTINNAWLAFDTVAEKLYYYDGGAWNAFTPVGGGIDSTQANNGLAMSGDTVQLGGTLTKNTEVDINSKTLRFRDAAGYPDLFLNGTYGLLGSDANTYLDVGSTAGRVRIVGASNAQVTSAGDALVSATDTVVVSGQRIRLNAADTRIQQVPNSNTLNRLMAIDSTTGRLYYVDKSSIAGGGGGMTSFTLAGTSGTPQTVADGETATVAAGVGISTTAGATRTVTVAADTSVLASKTFVTTRGYTTGSGTTGTIPVWSSISALGDSPLTVTSGSVTATGTGHFRLPNGTTAERPGTPTAGMTRYSTTNGTNEWYGASAWERGVRSASATGLGTATRVAFSDANGRLTDASGLTWTGQALNLTHTTDDIPTSGLRIINTSTGTNAARTSWYGQSSTMYLGATSEGYPGAFADLGFILVDGNASGGQILGTLGSTPLNLWTNSASRLHISGAGSVGIGNTSPQRTFHVTGEARVTDLTTDTPTRIVGADADGDLGAITVGTGLSFSGGALTALPETGLININFSAADAANSTLITATPTLGTKFRLISNIGTVSEYQLRTNVTQANVIEDTARTSWAIRTSSVSDAAGAEYAVYNWPNGVTSADFRQLWGLRTAGMVVSRGAAGAVIPSADFLGRLTVISSTSSEIAQVLRAASGQTANILEMRNSAGAGLSAFSAAGALGIGNAAPSRTLHVTGEARVTDLTTTTATVGVGADADGVLSSYTFGAGLSFAANALTASNLYNANGTLTGARTVTLGSNALTFSGTAGAPAAVNFSMNPSTNTTTFQSLDGSLNNSAKTITPVRTQITTTNVTGGTAATYGFFADSVRISPAAVPNDDAQTRMLAINATTGRLHYVTKSTINAPSYNFAELTVSGGSTSATAGTPERPDNDTPGTATSTIVGTFTASGSTLDYTGAAGQGKVSAVISFTTSGGGEVLISIYKEGTEIASTEMREAVNAVYTTVALPTITTALATNDTFEIRIEPVTGSNTITVHRSTLLIEKLY